MNIETIVSIYIAIVLYQATHHVYSLIRKRMKEVDFKFFWIGFEYTKWIDHGKFGRGGTVIIKKLF